jgi:hypothetical protein
MSYISLGNKKKLGKDILKRKVGHHALRSFGGFLLSAIVKIQLEKSMKGGASQCQMVS